MAKKSKATKFYAVRKGRRTGVFNSWAECERQTKGYSGAIFKSFQTIGAAERFVDSCSGVLSGPNAGNVAQNSKRIGQKRGNETKDADKREVTKRRKSKEGAVLEESVKTPSETNLSILIHFDGGSRGNPGVAGAGAVLQVKERINVSNEYEIRCQTAEKESSSNSKGMKYVEKKKIIKIRKFCGCNTNNYAEYQGVLCGLKEALSIIREFCTNLPKHENARIAVDVRGDSNLVINQIHGLYACKHPNLKPLHSECKNLVSFIENFSKRGDIENGNIVIATSFEHVYRSNNKISDVLANEAMDARKSWRESISASDDNSSNDKNLDESRSVWNDLLDGEFDVEEV